MTDSQKEDGAAAPRPPSAVPSSSSSGSGSSKYVRCIGRYILTGQTLGKGNFARVEAALHTLTRSKVAIKIIETDKIKEEYVRKNLLREAQLMRRLHHPNIIRLYETMKTNNLYCLVTEVAEGGELLSHVRNDFKERKLSEAVARPFIRQLVSALHHLHGVGVVHRDLKMENILLDKKKRHVKIVDFGLSNAQKPGSLLQTHCGSPEYAAPELFVPGKEYGPEVDVWSLGVNMYAMLVGKLPFRSPRQGAKRRQKLLDQITAGLVDIHEKEMCELTSEARHLISQLLQPDAQQRVSLEAVMSHPWVTKGGAQPLQPYLHTPPDIATQQAVVELMSTCLEVSQADIKETVRRDRCDWLAAIFNLLIDQPEGRAVLQGAEADNLIDQLTDASQLQRRSEHLKLSQGASQDGDAKDMDILINSTAQGSAGYSHHVTTQEEYDCMTLPTTKKEKKRAQSIDESRPVALNPVQVPAHYHDSRAMHMSRRLPATPTEEPYSHHHSTDAARSHSRAESEPNPLPVPFKPKLPHRTPLARLTDQIGPTPQSMAHTLPYSGHVPPSMGPAPPSMSPASLYTGPSPPSAERSSQRPSPRSTGSPPSVGPATLSIYTAPSASPVNAPSISQLPSLPKVMLEPIEESEAKQHRMRPRSMSLTTGPPRNHSTGVPLFGGARWRARAQVAPLKQEMDPGFKIGWSAQFGGKQIPGDIKAMMSFPPPLSAYNSVQNLYAGTEPSHAPSESAQGTQGDHVKLSHGLPSTYAESPSAEMAAPKRKSLSATPSERVNMLSHAIRTTAPEVSSVKELVDNTPSDACDEQKSHQIPSVRKGLGIFKLSRKASQKNLVMEDPIA